MILVYLFGGIKENLLDFIYFLAPPAPPRAGLGLGHKCARPGGLFMARSEVFLMSGFRSFPCETLFSASLKGFSKCQPPWLSARSAAAPPADFSSEGSRVRLEGQEPLIGTPLWRRGCWLPVHGPSAPRKGLTWQIPTALQALPPFAATPPRCTRAGSESACGLPQGACTHP